MYNHRKRNLNIKYSILLLLLLLQGGGRIFAQNYKVESFKLLSNDVSAFVSPIYDLNHDACALLKVIGGREFDFSTPLGIVKRKEFTGESWLYIPKGSKIMTIKHSTLGIIRNYKFEKALESNLTYEMKLSLMPINNIIRHDTIVMEKSRIDTIMVPAQKTYIPRAVYPVATIGLYKGEPSFGVMLAYMHRHGVYIHAQYNFNSTGKTIASCDSNGNIIGESGNQPFYSGEKKSSNFVGTIGAIHRINTFLNIYEGIGYWKRSVAWQLSESDGYKYVLNKGLSHKGMSFEAGLLLHWKRFAVTTNITTQATKYWMPALGIGYKL